MRISIIGTGYVGLVSGACLAEVGHDVTCVDLDPTKVDAINAGRAPIHEAGLPELLQRVVGRKLRATADLAAAVQSSDVTFIAVGTPAADGKIDLQYVKRAAEQIGSAMRGKPGRHTVVVKSTVIPGTTDGPVRQALEAGSGLVAGRDFGLGMNPEFLTEGQAIEDFMRPDRIVLGGIDESTRDALAVIYAPFAGAPVIRTNNKTAEMIKYASNAALATMISFANEFGRLCSTLGDVDVRDVMQGVHASTYFTTRLADGTPVKAAITSFLEAGCGYGGSCLPKDVTALVAQGRDHGLPMSMLSSVLEINAGQPAEVLRLVRKHVPDLAGVRVAVLGIAFKPDTDDVRESPAFPVIRLLRQQGAVVSAYDPIARPADHPALAGVQLADSLREALEGAAVVVLVTRWSEFQQLPGMLREMGSTPLVVDGRRVLEPSAFRAYEGIGR
jgi:UDPglucose 6-dehydrogenase